MDELKNIIAENIVELRKAMHLTQAELAEKLNYSDKAVSKWERGESIPDISVLKQISDMAGVKVDFLLEKEHPVETIAANIKDPHTERNHLIITLLSCSVVWLIATIFFVTLGIYNNGVENLWIIFVYSIPVTMIVLLVFNSLWGKPKLNFLIITILVWTILLSVYLSLISYKIWLIFIIGIPAQIIILLCAGFRFDQKKMFSAVRKSADQFGAKHRKKVLEAKEKKEAIDKLMENQ